MQKGKYKVSFDRLHVDNRWKRPFYSRSGSWIFIGIDKWWASPEHFMYRISFFGFALHIWFKREFIVDTAPAKK